MQLRLGALLRVVPDARASPNLSLSAAGLSLRFLLFMAVPDAVQIYFFLA